MKLVAAVVLLAACDDAPSSGPPDGDMHTIVDAPPMADAPPGCELPDLDQPWLANELNASLGALAASPRATTSGRNTARTTLQGKLTALGLTPELHTYSGGTNVYATIPSTNGGDKTIVVGAHYDTVQGSPGANDNASGCAVTLAIAHYLTLAPCRSANVIVAFFDQEEVGLLGANAFAGKLISEGGDVIAVHTVDQVAWDGDNDHLFELEQPTQLLAMQYGAAAQLVGVPTHVVSTGGTDHEAFRDRGFNAVGITEEYAGGDTTPYRHTANDTTSTVDAGYLALAAKLVARVVLVTAQ